MSHYELRLQRDLDDIHARFGKIAAEVETAIADALRTVLTCDEDLAYRTILNDERINREVRELDRLCHKFVAVHLPSAGPLRRMSSVIRTNIQLERLGDYAVIICREAVQLSRPPEGSIARKTHGEHARFRSAGQDPAAALDSRMVTFMERHGFDMSAMAPRAVADELAHLDRYYLVVSLDGPVRSCVPRVPFHTCALTWDLGSVGEETGDEDAARQFETIYRDLAVRIDDLMQVLAGAGEA